MKKRFFLLVLLGLNIYVSCSGMIEQPGFVSIFSGDDENITLKDFKQSENNEITLIFEGKVNKLQTYALKENSADEILCTIQEIEASEFLQNNADIQKNGETPFSVFKIIPDSDFDVGEDFKICGQVSYGINQFLDFELPFKGSNSNPAELSFYSIKPGSTSKQGFIRFSSKKSGNLFGLTIVNAGNSKEPNYVFPPFEVEKGNIIVLYWFLPLDGSEPYDGSLILSDACEALEAGEKAFCFWGRVQKFQPKKTNAILIRAGEGKELQDAVLFRNPKDEGWGKDEIARAALEASDAGLWKPDGDISNAVQANITPSKKIKRISLETINHNSADWILTK